MSPRFVERSFFLALFAVVVLLQIEGSLCAVAATSPAKEKSPNIIVILCDNLGYSDIGCFGSTKHRTPNIDRLATEGMRLTGFYVSSGVCTPSRASLMTGCYPRRVNMHVSSHGGAVLQPVESKGLNPSEITVAEVLKSQGYATALIGKWHLGDQPPFLPTRQGFDYYFGIPYSDDMTARPGKPWPPLPLMRQEKVIEAPVDRNLLTKRYTEETIRFLTEHREEPFFICLTHAMPGSTRVPFASEAFRGKSANGPWGDSVEEIDFSTGQIVDALKRLNLDKNTLIVWTSDNGAPQRRPPQGSNLPLRGWGYTTAEGGMRVPCIVRWPGKIPARTTSDELMTTMDLLPTFAYLAGTHPPDDRMIDGKNIWPIWSGQSGARSPHQAFFYYQIAQLQAVRDARWKLYVPYKPTRRNPFGTRKQLPLRLYDLKSDLGESTNVADEHPKVVERLLGYIEQARKNIGDVDHPGKNQRPAGRIENPTPRSLSTVHNN